MDEVTARLQSEDIVTATFERLKDCDAAEREVACEYVAERLGPDAKAELLQRLATHDRSIEKMKIEAAVAQRGAEIEKKLAKTEPIRSQRSSQSQLVNPNPSQQGETTPTIRRHFDAKPAEPPRAEAGNAEPGQGRIVLSHAAPYDTAKYFAERECRLDGKTVVWFWQDQFWRWNGKYYAPERDEEMRGKVYRFLDSAERWVGQNQTVRFQPTPRHVNDVLDCLKTGLALGVECQPPTWLSKQERATEWIVFQNGIVNVKTGEVRQPTPDLWAHSALSFDWDPQAVAPQWQQFLDEIFPNDPESREFIEQWMGYCMTEETRFQKGAMFIGPKRSGKGTISNVLRQLVGDPNYVGLSFSTWAVSENSKECLIGKRVGCFADVRFKPGRAYGSSYDPGGITHTSAELLLNITGEDTINIGRKYKTPWHGQLRLKLMLISNEVPNLNDTSGVLPSRFIKVNFGVSFYGREDVNLRARLSGELPGIAARCVWAYQRLCSDGQFTQPQSGLKLERDVLATSDPMTAMATECFVLDPTATITKTAAYNCFDIWCYKNGRMDLKLTTPENKFGKRLRQVSGFENLGEYRAHGKPRSWIGFRLTRSSEREDD